MQEFITLDGVVQGGGGPDEDREGGFELGGWAMEYDEQHDRADEGGPLITEWEGRVDALLLGRRTYDIWAGAWGVWDEDADGLMGELTRRYNRVTKHVASRSQAGARAGSTRRCSATTSPRRSRASATASTARCGSGGAPSWSGRSPSTTSSTSTA